MLATSGVAGVVGVQRFGHFEHGQIGKSRAGAQETIVSVVVPVVLVRRSPEQEGPTLEQLGRGALPGRRREQQRRIRHNRSLTHDQSSNIWHKI